MIENPAIHNTVFFIHQLKINFMNTEELNLLKSASAEIKGLRNRNQLQGIRLQMFDDMMLLLRTTPGYGASQGMGEDVAWQIDMLLIKHEEESK